MTAVDDRLKLGEERRLIFQNLANGVPMQSIMAVFRRSEAEVWKEVEFVGRKIREYRFRRRMPPVELQGIKAILFNRRQLLETLEKLGNDYLSSELIIPKITTEALDHPSIISEVNHRTHGAVKVTK